MSNEIRNTITSRQLGEIAAIFACRDPVSTVGMGKWSALTTEWNNAVDFESLLPMSIPDGTMQAMEWRERNWGTKCGAGEVEVTDEKISFLTKWKQPIGIIYALAKYGIPFVWKAVDTDEFYPPEVYRFDGRMVRTGFFDVNKYEQEVNARQHPDSVPTDSR